MKKIRTLGMPYEKEKRERERRRENEGGKEKEREDEAVGGRSAPHCELITQNRRGGQRHGASRQRRVTFSLILTLASAPAVVPPRLNTYR